MKPQWITVTLDCGLKFITAFQWEVVMQPGNFCPPSAVPAASVNNTFDLKCENVTYNTNVCIGVDSVQLHTSVDFPVSCDSSIYQDT